MIAAPRVVASLIVGLLVSSCVGTTTPHDVGTVEVGADLPLSGDDANDGIPVRNAIELAINEAGRICGASAHTDACVTLRPVILDDVTKGIHDPATGAANVQRLVAETAVVGIIGPIYDSVARSELPVANAGHLAMISPAATDECLTQEPTDGRCSNLASRLRPSASNNFFRVVASESAQGPAGAQLAFATLGARAAFVVDDNTALGKALAQSFQTQFVLDGGKIVSPPDQHVFGPTNPAGLATIVQHAQQSGATVLYFAGSQFDAAALLRREMAGSLQVPLVGTDQLATDQFAKLAGANVRGSYFTVIGPYAAEIAQAQEFIRDYESTYAAPIGPYSLPAFDATNIVIGAISRAIDDAGGEAPTRAQVLKEVAATKNFHGAMGTMSFDANGDTTLKLLTAYEWLAPTDPTGRFVAQIALN